MVHYVKAGHTQGKPDHAKQKQVDKSSEQKVGKESAPEQDDLIPGHDCGDPDLT